MDHTHIVFSTKHRAPLISSSVKTPLHNFMAGILNRMECQDILINGVEDHVHIYCRMTKKFAPVALMESLKKDSSKWVKANHPLPNFYWQDGYGWFSISPSHVDDLKSYIRNQEEHHRTVTFQEEYRKLLQRYGLECDERYLWD